MDTSSQMLNKQLHIDITVYLTVLYRLLTERCFPWLVISRFRAETSVRMRIHTRACHATFL